MGQTDSSPVSNTILLGICSLSNVINNLRWYVYLGKYTNILSKNFWGKVYIIVILAQPGDNIDKDKDIHNLFFCTINARR